MATKQSTRPNGYIVHSDANRVVIVTGFARKSKNAKTGNMLQMWILATKQDPIDAIISGRDKVVCGSCPLRGSKGNKRTCYVNLGQAPLMVYRAWKNGSYTKLADYSKFAGRAIRFGAYGDPAFVPLSVIRNIATQAARHTGYTHQWRNPLFSGLRDFVMASADNLADAEQAHALGWRTFRVAKNLQTTAGEIVCPNTTRGITCEACGLCNGASSAKSILIEAHGAGKKHLTV